MNRSPNSYKAGRNDPCPCGSRKKFKKCHGSLASPGSLDLVPPDLLSALLQRQEALEKQRQKQQGLGRPIISEKVGDQRVVAVGADFLVGKWKTFHDFLFEYIKQPFGKDWWLAQANKQAAERHPLLELCFCATEQLSKAITQRGTVHKIPATGNLAAVLRLAYDLYLLSHNVGVQSVLIERLKKADQFWGAYYETTASGILIRAGFDIEFEDESDVTSTHCEFVATYRETGRKFSVEAKWRTQGKTHFDVGNQLYSALKKRASHDRIVFIEVNVAQPEGTSPQATLAQVLAGLTSREQKLSIDGQPAPPAYLILTNNPFLHHPDSPFQEWAAAEGFKIPDFKINAPFSNLREALEARERHREMFAVMDSIRLHNKVPKTFDGELPIFGSDSAFGRLLVGQRYLLDQDDGTKIVGTLTCASADPEGKDAVCVFQLPDGKNVIHKVPLTAAETAAYRDHPETFFGRYDPHAAGPINDPLELYDRFHKTFSSASKEQILQHLKDAEDFPQLKDRSREDLLSIYCERLVYGFLQTVSQNSPAAGTTGPKF